MHSRPYSLYQGLFWGNLNWNDMLCVWPILLLEDKTRLDVDPAARNLVTSRSQWGLNIYNLVANVPWLRTSPGTFLMAAQWLRLSAPNTGDASSIPGQRTSNPHAAQCCQKDKVVKALKKKKPERRTILMKVDSSAGGASCRGGGGASTQPKETGLGREPEAGKNLMF